MLLLAKDPFSIILTESKAKKYFGDANAIGQVIRVDTVNYTVQGVIKDNPVNSSFRFDILMQMDGYLSNPETLKNDKTWNNFGYITFLQLRPDAGKSLVETRLNDIINKNRTNHTDKVSLEPLMICILKMICSLQTCLTAVKKDLYIFSCHWFVVIDHRLYQLCKSYNSKASLRAKEVSVRKIVGAERPHLFFQFIAESLTVSLLALGITLLIVQICLPVFNTITEKHLELSLTSITLWKVLSGTLLFATLLNGIYPAHCFLPSNH